MATGGLFQTEEVTWVVGEGVRVWHVPGQQRARHLSQLWCHLDAGSAGGGYTMKAKELVFAPDSSWEPWRVLGREMMWLQLWFRKTDQWERDSRLRMVSRWLYFVRWETDKSRTGGIVAARKGEQEKSGGIWEWSGCQSWRGKQGGAERGSSHWKSHTALWKNWEFFISLALSPQIQPLPVPWAN